MWSGCSGDRWGCGVGVGVLIVVGLVGVEWGIVVIGGAVVGGRH